MTTPQQSVVPAEPATSTPDVVADPGCVAPADILPITGMRDPLHEIWAVALALHRVHSRAEAALTIVEERGPLSDLRHALDNIVDALEELIPDLMVEVALQAAPLDVLEAA